MKLWEGKGAPGKAGCGREAMPSSAYDKKTAVGLILSSGARNGISALLFLTLSVTLAEIKTLCIVELFPRKMEVILYQSAKEGYYFKH